VLALPGAARGGFYFPPPADTHPIWSPDGSSIVYYGTAEGLHVVSPDGSGDRLLPLPSTPYFAFSRDWHWIVLDVFSGTAGRENIVVSRPDGSEARIVGTAFCCFEPSFSPDRYDAFA